MEPVNLNSVTAKDERLDALLRQAVPGPLADDGFSTRVLTTLPPPRRGWPTGWRAVILVGAAVAAVALGGSDFGPVLNQGVAALAAATDLFDQPDLWLAVALIIGVLAATANDEAEGGRVD
jgi:hypothetical protein